MKLLFKIFLLIGTLVPAIGQKLITTPDAPLVDTSFNQIVEDFDQWNPRRKDTIVLPTIFIDKNYKIVLADSALRLAKKRFVLTNPFSTEKYPLSYSILDQNHLISLFAPGYFACFNINNWQRNLTLEKQLNTKKFERHWLIDCQIIALSAGLYWQFTPEVGWQVYAGVVPFKDRPKLFEDADYLVYNECKGEFGGRVFFFNKQTKKNHWIESTCAVWVRHSSQGYEVLSNLGHGTGSADNQLIVNPDSLPEWKGKSPERTDARAVPESPATQFDIYGVQLFGGLQRENQILYLLHFANRTCLASLSDTTFTVVDPLFNDGLYTHDPVTTEYDGTTLINLDLYGIGRYQEISCLLIRNDQVTLIDWHESHPR